MNHLEIVIAEMRAAGNTYSEILTQMKRALVLDVLKRHKGNQCAAAAEMGVHRNSLKRALDSLEIEAPKGWRNRSKAKEQIRQHFDPLALRQRTEHLTPRQVRLARMAAQDSQRAHR